MSRCLWHAARDDASYCLVFDCVDALAADTRDVAHHAFGGVLDEILGLDFGDHLIIGEALFMELAGNLHLSQQELLAGYRRTL